MFNPLFRRARPKVDAEAWPPAAIHALAETYAPLTSSPATIMIWSYAAYTACVLTRHAVPLGGPDLGEVEPMAVDLMNRLAGFLLESTPEIPDTPRFRADFAREYSAAMTTAWRVCVERRVDPSMTIKDVTRLLAFTEYGMNAEAEDPTVLPFMAVILWEHGDLLGGLHPTANSTRR